MLNFDIKSYLQRRVERKRAYCRLFFDERRNLKPDAEVVLNDLRKFCRASQSTAQISPITKTLDSHAMALAEGRREVWIRLMTHLHLSDDTFLKSMEVATDG